jgi:predicted Zn-dependent peptidase
LDKRRHIQQYPPGTQINFVSFDNQNSLTRNGKDFFCPEGRRGRAGEPGFPARHILYYSVPEPREIRYHFREKPGQKTTHMQISFITCSMFDDDRHILNMLEHILGGLFGSKLSILLRENNGLTYTSNCTTEYHEHSGDISIYAQVDKRKLIKNGDKPGLIPLIIGLFNNLLKNGITAEELNVAKKNKKAKLHLSLESLESQAEYNGKEWLLFQDPDNIVPIHKFYDRHFKGITRTQILGVLRKYIKKSSMTVCFVGEDFPSGVLIDRECQKLTNH